VQLSTADLGQEHGILARLDFSPILSQVDLVDQRGSQMLDRRIMDRSVDSSERLPVRPAYRRFVSYSGGFLSRHVSCFVARDVHVSRDPRTSPLTCISLALSSYVSSDSFAMAFSSD